MKAFCWIILLLSLQLLTIPVCAEDLTNSIDEGMSFYESGDFDAAVQKLKRAINELKSRPAGELNREKLFTANLYLAMTYVGKGMNDMAKEYLKEAFITDPQKTLDPQLIPPKVILLYDEVAKSFSQLTIKSNIQGAKVYIDGTYKGHAPVTLRALSPGRHTVKLTTPGQKDKIKTVTLKAGKKEELTINFQVFGSISVTSDPLSATVYLDGKTIGVSPILISKVPKGEHEVTLYKPGYVKSSQKVQVKKDTVTEVYVSLNQVSYSVRISSIPEGAQVYYDGILKGVTPLTFDEPTAGLHKVRVIKEGYQEQREDLEVKNTITERTYRLLAYTGGLNINTKPAGAQVLIDNILMGRTPLTIEALPIDKYYAVTLKKEGYNDINFTVVIAKDKITEINKTFPKVDKVKPEIIFEPLSKVIKENKNVIRARITDDQKIKEANLLLKIQGEMNYQRIKMTNSSENLFEAVIPDVYLTPRAVIEYFIDACDMQDNCVTSGSKDAPYRINVISLEPYTEGFIVSIDDDNYKVVISLGSVDGVKENDRYIVFRPGMELRDPNSGELLHIEEIFVGTIEVEEILQRTSYAEMKKINMPFSINDRIRKRVSAPSGLKTEGRYATKVILRWNPNPEPEVKGYHIYRGTSPDGEYSLIKRVRGKGNTVFEDTKDMKEGLIFYYKVAAFNILDTEGLMSEPVEGRTKKGVVPPKDLRVDGTRIREVYLKWDISEIDPDIDKYIVYRSERWDGPFTEIARVKKNKDYYIDREDLKDGVLYYYYLAGYSQYGSIGEPTPLVSGKTKERPSPPQNIRAVSGMKRMIKIQWDKHSDPDVVGYVVYKNKKGLGTFNEIESTRDTEFIDTGLSDGERYYYTVTSFYRVRGEDIEGKPSKAVSAVTKQRPSAPTGLSAESGLARSVVIKWNKNPEKDITEYWIYRQKNKRNQGSLHAKVKANVTAFRDTGLKDNTEYIYSVKAVDADGLESRLSDSISAVTKPLPRPPKGLTGYGSKGKVTLSWQNNKETDIAGYNVYKKGWFKDQKISTCKQNHCNIRFDDKTESVTLYITAFDNDGLESNPSSEIEITLQK